jgi:cell division septum initiation protein DivIVA
MARPAETEIGHQAPESSAKTTTEQTTRRESYTAGEPTSAPELVRFMGCRTTTDIGKIADTDLLKAAKQASGTIADWEIAIITQDSHNQDLQVQIEVLQAQLQEKENIIRYLERNRSTSATPAPASSKSTKIPDPEPLTDGKNPTFENWKIQIEGKFVVNHDHFVTEQAKMIYLFGRTTGDAQRALQTRYGTAKNPFQTSKDMIDHLSNIYLDPYKVENARQDYRRLNMKPVQTFTEFYTRFLQLAGDAEIPQEDWRPDLYEKLTLDIRRAVIPVYDTLVDYQALADKCRRVDQDLKRLKESSDRLKARQASNAASKPTKPSSQNTSTNSKPPTSAPPAPDPAINPISGKPRPKYDDPDRQALSREGKCFKCQQFGHYARDCPTENNVIQELEGNENKDSGKDQP